MEAHDIDFIEAGSGPRVILVHSSVAGAKQWRSLIDTLAGYHHVIAINLFGYGSTPAWDATKTQSLEDQAGLIAPFLPTDGGQVSIVGHSFGGSVAMKAAALFKDRVRRLVLVEPNPFYLLNDHDRPDAFKEATRLRDIIKTNGRTGAWDIAAEEFANYWTGAGSWDAMPDDRQQKFSRALMPNFFEWDAVMNERTSLGEWQRDLPENTTVVSAADTVRSISEIAGLFQEHCPGWTFKNIERGGHMAVMTNPGVVNPIIIDALS